MTSKEWQADYDMHPVGLDGSVVPALIADLAATEAVIQSWRDDNEGQIPPTLVQYRGVCEALESLEKERDTWRDAWETDTASSRAEAAEKRAAALEVVQQNVIDVAMADLSDQLVKSEAVNDKLDARCESAEKRLAEVVGELSDFCHHEYPCLLAQWHEGRPTSDGGYETRYGDKWYQRDDKPPCTCGLDAALTHAHEEVRHEP